MGKWLSRGALGAVVLVGITVKWSLFNSTVYPYTITQPSTFKHEVLTSSTGQLVDYFFAVGLGSFTTNVNISASRGTQSLTADDLLRADNGTDVKQSGWLRVMGHNLRLTRATFRGLVGTWIEEAVTFTAGGYSWRLTASYDPRYKSLRSTMLRMLSSFKLH
jgi:hypothetical protein